MDITTVCDLKPEDVFVDIGGHDGSVCKAVMDKFKCYATAFEPNPDKIAYLKRLKRLYPKFQYAPVAVGGTFQNSELHIYGLDGGADSLYKRADRVERKYPWHERYLGAKEVKQVTFDDVIKTHGEIALCNMDCEGAELFILTLASDEALKSVAVYLIEFHVFDDFEIQHTQANVDMCLKTMKDLGFEAERVGNHPDYILRRT